MSSQQERHKPGVSVVLTTIPPDFLDGLPSSDQRAITAIVGQPVRFVEYDEIGRAELEFIDESGEVHYIYVKPEFIRRA